MRREDRGDKVGRDEIERDEIVRHTYIHINIDSFIRNLTGKYSHTRRERQTGTHTETDTRTDRQTDRQTCI